MLALVYFWESIICINLALLSFPDIWVILCAEIQSKINPKYLFLDKSRSCLLHLGNLVTFKLTGEAHQNQNSGTGWGTGCHCGLPLLSGCLHSPYITLGYSSSHSPTHFPCLGSGGLSELGFHSKKKQNGTWIHQRLMQFCLEVCNHSVNTSLFSREHVCKQKCLVS